MSKLRQELEPHFVRITSFVKAHSVAFAVGVMLLSIAMLAYPFVSDWLYTRSTSKAAALSAEATSEMSEDVKRKLWDEANEYNNLLVKKAVKVEDPFNNAENQDELEKVYYDSMRVDQDGLMCFVEVPSINVYLPVFHGTDAETLENGAGHLFGSSMPVGGKNTHSVISAHTGLSRARMFTDLVDVKQGEQFFIHTLGQVLAYQVDQITVVTPSEVSGLGIVQNEDLCTLVTCTPYGVNSHRLLVRGHRVPYDKEAADRVREMALKLANKQSQWTREYLKAASGGIGVIAGITVFGILHKKRKMTTIS